MQKKADKEINYEMYKFHFHLNLKLKYIISDFTKSRICLPGKSILVSCFLQIVVLEGQLPFCLLTN